jgi:hypothetical protein
MKQNNLVFINPNDQNLMKKDSSLSQKSKCNIYPTAVSGHQIKIERGCVSGHDNVCKFLGGNLPHVECFTCKKNLCNGVTPVSALSAATVALTSLFVTLRF